MIDRLRLRDDFRRLRLEGRRRRCDPLWCSTVHDSAVFPPRVAFSFARTAGNAVARNRLRRRLKEILRTEDVPAGLWLFGVQRRAGAVAELADRPFEELRDTVRQLIDPIAARRSVPR